MAGLGGRAGGRQGHIGDLLAKARRHIGYAWLPIALSEAGQTVEAETEWGVETATVTPMPFVDPQKQIPLS